MGNFDWFWFYRWIDLEINILLWFFVVFWIIFELIKVMLISMVLDNCSKLGCVVVLNRVLLNFCFFIKLLF